MKIIKKVYFLIIILTVVSCDNYLDRAPGLTLSEEVVFTNFYNAEKFHNNIYVSLTDGFTTLGEVPLACVSDEADVYNPSSGFSAITIGNGSYDNIDAKISNFYTGIRKANEFINKESVIPFPSVSKHNMMMGEVYFLRAFYFNEMLKRFGGMPIMSETNIINPNDDLFLPRNSYKECVNYILEDLKKAINFLPVTLSVADYGRPTKGAAMALKARVLLYAASPLWQKEMQQDLWADAAQAALDVINLKDSLGVKAYELYTTGNGADDYENQFFKRRESGNKEIIFYEHAAPISFTNSQIINYAPKGGTLGGIGLVAPTQNFVDLFEMSNGKGINEGGSGYDPQNPYLNRDPRFYKIVLYNGSAWQGSTIETFYNSVKDKSGIHRLDKVSYTRTGYYIRKFLPADVKHQSATTAYHNWIFFRLAEMYLNYAEALNETLSAPNTAVYEAVNLVRNRSGVVPLPEGLSKDDMRKRIQNERAIELCFEEHRWWDARRWGKGTEWFNGSMYEMEITKDNSGALIYAKKPFYNRIYRSYMDLYPIPLVEMKKNPLLKQNPGW